MSIYTDMIDYIDKHGISVGSVGTDYSGKTCLLGVAAEVRPFRKVFSAGGYTAWGLSELVTIAKRDMPKDRAVTRELNSRTKDYKWIYSYNDSVINGNKLLATAMLKEAEEMRKAKSV
ncbi:hypothetical protein PBI_GRAYSON_193 [Rhodococcus phage Grayson]|nr:hypothetical protein PBI_GRAYSON_193 [Rhodococcus phage Grayson]